MERKGVKDLASSIKDGRYGTQKYFLKLSGMARVMYLLEGDPDMEPSLTGDACSPPLIRTRAHTHTHTHLPLPCLPSFSEIERKQVKTASLTTNLNGFHVLYSQGTNQTLLLLANLTKAVERAYRSRTAGERERGLIPEGQDSLKWGKAAQRRLGGRLKRVVGGRAEVKG